MEFEWDPVKNESNLTKHGISFVAASRVFDDPHCIEIDVTRPVYMEKRFKAVGLVDDKFFTVIYTDRGPVRRIISARRARTDERRAYDQGTEAG